MYTKKELSITLGLANSFIELVPSKSNYFLTTHSTNDGARRLVKLFQGRYR